MSNETILTGVLIVFLVIVILGSKAGTDKPSDTPRSS